MRPDEIYESRGRMSLFRPGAVAEVTEDDKKEAREVFIIGVVMLLMPLFLAVGLIYARPYMKKYRRGFLLRGFGAAFYHRNRQFAATFDNSMRGMIGTLLLAIPFLTQGGNRLVLSGFYTGAAAMLFGMNLYKTVGETVCFCFGCLVGTCLACFNSFLLFSCFKYGTYDNSEEAHHIVTANGILFVLIILGLDLDLNIKYFALNWHCYFWMDVYNPERSVKYISAKHGHLIMTDPAVNALFQSCIGTGMAVLVTLIPSPMFALDKVADGTRDVAELLADAWASAITCFTSRTKVLEVESSFQHSSKALTKDAQKLLHLVHVSWWETWGLPGSPQRIRSLSVHLCSCIADVSDRLRVLSHLCKVTERSEDHVKLMGQLKSLLESLSRQTRQLLKTLVDAALDGCIDETETALIAEEKRKVSDAMAVLSRAYEASQKEMQTDLLHQAAFCQAYCSYARLIMDFAEVLEKDMQEQSAAEWARAKLQGLTREMETMLLGVMRDFRERNCFLRSAVCILLNFVWGYHGFSLFLPKYNGVPSATVSLLLSRGLTAQAGMTLARLEGVVLGTVLGQVAYATLGWCSRLGYAMTGGFLAAWSLVTSYMYYDAKSVATEYMAMLMWSFGLLNLLQPCSDTVFQSTHSYYTVVSIVLSITLKFVCDLFLAGASASDVATSKLISAWSQVQVDMQKFFSSEDGVMHFKFKEIKMLFNEARILSADAAEECRLWAGHWKHDLFVSVCEQGLGICEALAILEAVFADLSQSEDVTSKTPSNTLIRMSEPDAQKVNMDLVRHIEETKSLCNAAFKYEKDDYFAAEYQRSKGLCDYEVLQKRYEDLLSTARKDFKVESDDGSTGSGDSAQNLEHSVHCKLGSYLVCVQWILAAIERTTTEILRD